MYYSVMALYIMHKVQVVLYTSWSIAQTAVSQLISNAFNACLLCFVGLEIPSYTGPRCTIANALGKPLVP